MGFFIGFANEDWGLWIGGWGVGPMP